jgi:hypothetical protein
LIEIGLLFPRKRFLKTFSEFYSFAIISPLGRGLPFICKTLNPLPKDDLCQLWLKLAKRFWRRSQKSKSLTDGQTDGRTDGQMETDGQTTDNGQSEKLT